MILWEGPTTVNLETNAGLIIQAEAAYFNTHIGTVGKHSNVYTSDIWVVPYPGTDIVGRFSLDDQSCVGLQIDNGWPVPENHLWFKASVSNTEEWLS